MIRTSWSEPREQYSNTVAVRIGSANQPIVNKRKAKMNGDAKMRMTWEMSIRHKKFRPFQMKPAISFSSRDHPNPQAKSNQILAFCVQEKKSKL